MKKYIWISAACLVLLGTSCSGEGATSEVEKKAQDSVDEIRQDTGFDKLYQEEAKAIDSGSKTEEPKEEKKP
jgi:hypothetical protein